MRARTIAVAVISVVFGFAAFAGAEELSWRTGIAQIVQDRCTKCHGSAAKEYSDWNLGDKKDAPRMDTYPAFMSFVVWPATGAIMRRLDDGKGAPGGKTGNMYAYLGESAEERDANLAKIKSWLGEGAWNLNRWGARGEVPGITKEQLDKIKAKY